MGNFSSKQVVAEDFKAPQRAKDPKEQQRIKAAEERLARQKRIDDSKRPLLNRMAPAADLGGSAAKKSALTSTRASEAPVQPPDLSGDPTRAVWQTMPDTDDRDEQLNWLQKVSNFVSQWWQSMSNVVKKMHDAGMAIIGNSKS